MKQAALYIHGKGGSAQEAAHYRPLLPAHEVIGFDYHAQTPWEARTEFAAYFDTLHEKYDSVLLIANSIGAFFAMSALYDRPVERALLISPVVDMERLILDMLGWAGADEAALRARGEIPTTFGETLSWEYLSYVRAHPICWHVRTDILYGENDTLTAPGTIAAFSNRIGARLCVMPQGEHWFHTEPQLRFLDQWLLDAVTEAAE